MIKKLKTKVSLIILCAIIFPLFLVINFYVFSYYNNVIKSSTGFIDRIYGDRNGGPNRKKNNIVDITEMDGIYSVSISDGKVFSSSNNVTDEIKEYALKVFNKKSESGVIENYIYKKRPQNIKDTTIILVESTVEISKIRFVIISSVFVFCISVVLIYFLSKKIAYIIVKPVEETFSKQIDFISDASHELKTPLAVIQANVDVLEGKIGENKWLSYIQNEIDNMEKLISELLLLTKIESIGKLRNPETFNMSDHIELIAASFESMAFEKNVKIENKIQKNIITDNFNKDDITHILSTLIDNAIKHTEEKKKVIVEFIENKSNIEINIKNKGEEIPLSEREKIFDRFYRIDKSRNRNEKRYGLGLAIAKATVLKNNGTIHVNYKNGYTIFTVKLPL